MAMPMPVIVPMPMRMSVMVVSAGRPHAKEVDREAQAGHEEQLLELHLGRIQPDIPISFP